MVINRHIFVGDVHACVYEMQELFDKLHYDPVHDRMILLGDLIDRGPDSVGVVELARKMNLECIRGNHENRFIKWFRSQGSRTDVYEKRPHYTQFTDQQINYIVNMPLYIELDDVIAVHAGLKPGILLSNQRPDDLMYLRYTDAERKFISLKTIGKIGVEASGARFWTEFGPFGKNVIYGHQVWAEPRIDRYEGGTAAYGIDTGCCFGGHLTALIWENKEIVQVKAKKEYYKPNFTMR